MGSCEPPRRPFRSGRGRRQGGRDARRAHDRDNRRRRERAAPARRVGHAGPALRRRRPVAHECLSARPPASQLHRLQGRPRTGDADRPAGRACEPRSTGAPGAAGNDATGRWRDRYADRSPSDRDRNDNLVARSIDADRRRWGWSLAHALDRHRRNNRLCRGRGGQRRAVCGSVARCRWSGCGRRRQHRPRRCRRATLRRRLSGSRGRRLDGRRRRCRHARGRRRLSCGIELGRRVRVCRRRRSRRPGDDRHSGRAPPVSAPLPLPTLPTLPALPPVLGG